MLGLSLNLNEPDALRGVEEVAEEAAADGDHGLGVLRVLAVIARAKVVDLHKILNHDLDLY